MKSSGSGSSILGFQKRGEDLIETSITEQTHKSRSVNLKRSIGEARVPWLFIPGFMSEIATLRAKIRFLRGRRRVYRMYKPDLEESNKWLEYVSGNLPK